MPRNAFAQPTVVTLTLMSSDGTDYPGAIGPVFALSKTDALGHPVTLQKPATFELNFTPADTSIPAERVALAYFDTQSNPNLWIAIVGSSYDPGTGVLSRECVRVLRNAIVCSRRVLPDRPSLPRPRNLRGWGLPVTASLPTGRFDGCCHRCRATSAASACLRAGWPQAMNSP